MIKLTPTKTQFKNWTLPSKITYIACVIGLVALLLMVIFFLIQQSGGASKKDQKKTHAKLDRLLPKIHALPELNFSLRRIPSNFAAGIQVGGLTWEADFSQYFLKITNTKAEIQDLRIDIDFVGGIVAKEIRLQEGTDHITFSEQGFFNTGIGKKGGKIHKTIETYTNNLKISCSKLFSTGFFEIKIILKELNIDDTGLFEVSYRYLNENNEQKQWGNRYKILKHDNGASYIDSENPFKGTVKRSLSMIPKKPLVFKKDGSIEEKK